MENKIYKNEKMIRKIHRVTRVVLFDSEDAKERFMNLYQDVFGVIYGWDFENRISVGFTIGKNEFDRIVKDLELVNIKTKHDKTKYWEFKGA